MWVRSVQRDVAPLGVGRAILAKLTLGSLFADKPDVPRWAYNIDTKVLVRVLAAPAGGECTSLQVVDNLNGSAYVMSAMQHLGDWSWNEKQSAAGSLKENVAANWGGVIKRSANGYLAVPVLN